MTLYLAYLWLQELFDNVIADGVDELLFIQLNIVPPVGSNILLSEMFIAS